MKMFKTESGSVYEIAGNYVRRVPTNPREAKRADARWVQLLTDPEIKVGERAVLYLESLQGFGADDNGFVGDSSMTCRTTTPVVEVWGD